MPEFFERKFAINDIFLYPPDDYREEPVPVVGTNLAGEPIRQGHQVFTFTWSFMKQAAMTALMEAYTPESPQKTVTYIDKATGELRDMVAMMHEPVVGGRQIIYYVNVALRFSHCEPI